MKRQAFVFDESSYSYDLTGTPLAQRYAKWINDLLREYPDAQFEVHQTMGTFFNEKEQMDWIQVFALVIVTES